VKNNFFFSLAGIVLALVMGNAAAGQTTKNQGQHSSIASANSASADSENYNLNGKAVRDFTRTFNNVSGESWSSSPDGYVVTFTLHETDYMIFYDQTGDKLYTIRNYHEAKLPHEIRHLVKRKYYDFDIRLVQEIANDFGTTSAYFIHLEGKTQWITARVSNGHIDEFERFDKAE
jgi:hypothetical protein